MMEKHQSGVTAESVFLKICLAVMLTHIIGNLDAQDNGTTHIDCALPTVLPMPLTKDTNSGIRASVKFIPGVLAVPPKVYTSDCYEITLYQPSTLAVPEADLFATSQSSEETCEFSTTIAPKSSVNQKGELELVYFLSCHRMMFTSVQLSFLYTIPGKTRITDYQLPLSPPK